MAEIFQFPKPPRADAEKKPVSNVRKEPIEWSGDPSQAVVGLGRGLMYRLRENNGAFGQSERASIIDALKADPSHDTEVRTTLESGLGDTEFRASLISVLHFREAKESIVVLRDIVFDVNESALVRLAAFKALSVCSKGAYDWIPMEEGEWSGKLEPLSEEE